MTAPPGERAFGDPAGPPDAPTARPVADGDEAAMTRINLRLPQDLKDRVEGAAAEAGISVNAWLVRSAAAALGESDPARRRSKHDVCGSGRYTGWVR